MTDPLHSEVLAFVDVADEYCALIDSRRTHVGAALVHNVHRLLPRLYSAALALPEVEPENPDDDGPEPMSREEWRALFQDIGSLLAAQRYYREIFNPYDLISGEEEPVVGDLADDLADIYRDLRAGLTLWSADRPRDAIWAWRLHFKTHWSVHAISALRTVRALEQLSSLHHSDRPTADLSDDSLRACEAALRRAQLASDVAALERLVDDALVFIGPDGAVYGKPDDLDAHRHGVVRITRLEPSEERIQRFGNTAVVSVRMEMAGTFRGAAFAGPFRYTRVWCERPDGWRVVAGHVSAVVG